MKVKTSEATIAASIRSVVRSAYSGRFAGSRETAGPVRVASGARVWRAPNAARTRSPKTSGTVTASQRFGVKPRAVRAA